MSYISISELINNIELKQQEIDHKIETVKRLSKDIQIDQLILNSAVDAVEQLHQNQNQDKKSRSVNNQTIR